MTFYKHPLRKCSGCGNHLTSDRDHCALSSCPDVGKPFCTPPAENSEPAGASAGEDGQGVCIHRPNTNPLGPINRDKTGLRYVRKGCTVDYSGLRFLVQRVRLGAAYGVTLLGNRPVFALCSSLRVVLT